MDTSNPHEELLELLSRLADTGELEPDDARRFEEILAADPAARLLYMQHIDLQVELSCVAENGQSESAPQPAPASKIMRFPRRGFALAAGLVAVGVALFLFRGAGDDAVVARLDHIQGEVLITPAKGLPWSPHAVVDIRSSYSIQLRGDNSSAVLVYPDGTLVALVGDTEVAFNSETGKQLTMPRGVMAASVAKQPPNQPMTVSTPKAEVEIVGTEFTLESDSANTHLAVLEGAVDFVRNTDTRRVQVTEGKVATVGAAPEPGEAEQPLVAQEQKAPPAEWSIGFERGLPPGWKRGEFSAANLPAGISGAVNEERTYGDGKTYHQIETPSSFVFGQYQINADTHLHVTYKMDKPDWLNIFIGARSPELRGATWDTFLCNAINAGNTRPGVWQTVTIPLAAFREAAGSDTEIVGKFPYGFLISSTPKPRGLSVAAIWVTQGGPGEIQFAKWSRP